MSTGSSTLGQIPGVSMRVMQLRPINIANEKSKIERAGKDEEETEYDFLEIRCGYR
jgi:hypothetical protein